MSLHIPVEILLVEDSALDVKLTEDALREGKVRNNLHVVRDGEEALEFLFQTGRHIGAIRPHIILLDLNLPRIDGREVLAKIQADPVLRRIPVVVLTTSSADADVARTYDLNVNCFITKPVDMDQFMALVKAIDTFWLTIVRLPEREPSRDGVTTRRGISSSEPRT